MDLDFTHSHFRWGRPLTSYAKVQALITLIARNNPVFINRRALGTLRYLDIGCGPTQYPEFYHLDFCWWPGIHACWDIRKGFPFLPDNHFSGIFSEHCLEHVSLSHAAKAIRECYRVLQPGGTLRISVPDGAIYFRNALDGQSAPLAETEWRDGGYANTVGAYTPMMSVNRIMRFHGHQFIYDEQTLTLLFRAMGFVDMVRVQRGEGRDPVLWKDQAWRECETLTVEGTKPGYAHLRQTRAR